MWLKKSMFSTKVFTSPANVLVLRAHKNWWINAGKISMFLAWKLLAQSAHKANELNYIVHDADRKIHGMSEERVYATKFLGVIIDSKFMWKHHDRYKSMKKLSKCTGITINSLGASCIDHHSLLFIIHSLTHISSIATMCGEKNYVQFRKPSRFQPPLHICMCIYLN